MVQTISLLGMKIHLPLIFAALCEVSFARIGETIKECELRYGNLGEPSSSPGSQLVSYGVQVDEHLQIGLVFKNNKCVEIIYHQKSGSPATREEVDELLNKNFPDGSLKITSDSGSFVNWKSEKGDEAKAFIYGETLLFSIKTKESLDEQKRVESEKDRSVKEKEQQVKDRL